MEVHQVHIQAAQDCHGLFHRVGNVVELQIQKNFVAPSLDLPDNLGTFGIVQLHADFHKGFFTGKPVQEGQGLLPASKIAGHDHIFTHGVHLL